VNGQSIAQTLLPDPQFVEGDSVTRRKVLIVAPHFPPSNLAGVHRSRLFALHLPEFGWDPVIVSVSPKHYEEKLDYVLLGLLPKSLRVEHVGAIPTKPLRIVGDIGLRGFVPMLRRILRIIDTERVDFLYIPIPSFYAALLGPIVKKIRGTPYGIDYIDPWVHRPTGREGLKGRLSLVLARILEPFAVRKASLISGVAEGYYSEVLARHPNLHKQAVTVSMPYGAEPSDHDQVKLLKLDPALFPARTGRFRFVYAGALLPRAIEPLRRICSALSRDPELRELVEFLFIGTGKSPDDPRGYNVRPIAEEFGLWGNTINEHPARIPYLETLAHLEAADAVFVLGSTEPHYTPSKVFQGVLSNKPVLAVLHRLSTARQILQLTKSGMVLEFDGEADIDKIETAFATILREFIAFAAVFDPSKVNREIFRSYSARGVTEVLAGALDRALLADQSTAIRRREPRTSSDNPADSLY
jgi:hypothetical protein